MKEDKKERRTTKKGWKQADAKKFDIPILHPFSQRELGSAYIHVCHVQLTKIIIHLSIASPKHCDQGQVRQ